MAVLDYKLDEPHQLVSVIAPSDMPEGYKFDAIVNGQKIKAVVPPGGVVQGQAFLTPLSNYDGPNINAPTGHWKDGVFDCFSYGVFSSHLWCAWCCTQCAMGQVMQRLRLDWLGRQATELQSRSTFKVVFTLVVAYTLYSFMIDYMAPDYIYGNQQNPPKWVDIMSWVGAILMLLWTVYALMNTRFFTRTKYQIPEERCHGFEDLCCALWCSCCTVAQIARHTGEYETYRSECFSSTGLPNDAPAIV